MLEADLLLFVMQIEKYFQYPRIPEVNLDMDRDIQIVITGRNSADN